MPTRETEAIILRTFPLGEGDRLVSFFSRSEGRLRGAASGARKPKSRFGSTLEPLSYVRIWFYERETRDLVRIQQCDLIESFMDAQRDYTNALAFAVISETTEAILGEREPAEANFRLILAVARGIKAGAAPVLALAYFAFWSVRLGGWLPPFDRCAKCGSSLAGTAYISEAHGFVCGDCRLPGQRAISQVSLLLARRVASEKIELLMKSSVQQSTALELMNCMLDIVEHQIEKNLNSRKLFEQNLESRT